MIKKLSVLWLMLLVLLSSCLPAMAASNQKTLVVSSASDKVASTSGLALSSAYTHDADFTLRWSGADLNNTVRLKPSRQDWSVGGYLEFWVYQTRAATSSFGLALISDNDATVCIDHYKTIVDVSGKGWQLVSIDLAEMESVYQPKGFDSIDRVELWPGYEGTAIDAKTDLYFDNFYLCTEKSQSEATNDELILADLSTTAGISQSGYSGVQNTTVVSQAPEKTSVALCFKDEPKGSDGKSVSGLTFPNLPVSDFTSYSTLEVNMYSAHAGSDTFWFVCRVNNPTIEGNHYYYEKVTVDWEGWRTLQFKLKGMLPAGQSLSWERIKTIELWFYDSGIEADKTTLYIDKISLKNVDYTKQWTEPQYFDAVPETENSRDFAALIRSKFPNNQHPRLLLTEQDIRSMKENRSQDAALNTAIERMLELCGDYIKAVENPTDTRTSSLRGATLALAYLLTGEERYATAAWEKMLAVTENATNWTGDSMLSLGDTARNTAIAYDLMYNHWTEDQRRIVRNGIILYAFRPTRSGLVTINGGGDQETNWNAIINSGLGMAALAIADDEGYGDAANAYLNRIHLALSKLFRYYAPDGAGFEGPDYWQYTMENYLLYEEGLYNSVGKEIFEEYSMLTKYGMEKTGDFALQMMGTTGRAFNFCDGDARGIAADTSFFLADYFGRPELAGKSYESPSGDVRWLLAYKPNDEYKNWREKMALDYHGGGVTQAGAMRTSFENGTQGMYVGYKGNNANPATHGRLDAGAFVLDALGTRFVSLLANEQYLAPGMFGTQRFKYYRNRAEGSNTLVINPGVNQGTAQENDTQAAPDVLLDQKKCCSCPIIKTASEDWASYAVVDLTDAYAETATAAKRGFALLDSRNAFLLQDEITVKEPCTVYSFMHTEAQVTLGADKKSAILTRNGNKMKAKLISNCDAKLEVMEAVPLPTSPEAQNSSNSHMKKLAVSADVSGSASFAVLFTPYYGEGQYEYTLEGITPISRWDSYMAEPVTVNALYLDGVPIEGFMPEKTVYTLKEASVGRVTAEADNGITLDITQAANVGDVALVRATDREDNTTVYALQFSDETQKKLDDWSYYVPKKYLASINVSDAPKVMDGNIVSAWANAGPQWLAFDFGKPKPFGEVQIYWENQTKRAETFDIQVSDDAENWITVWAGDSVITDEIVSYTFDEVTARYVKVMGYKNTVNDWTTIDEMRVPCAKVGFDDVTGMWAQKDIEDMAKIDLVEGVGDRQYAPDEGLSRAAYVTMLARAFGLEEAAWSGAVSDASEGAWYTPYIEAAYAKNLIPSAMLADGFKPDQLITREEICALTVSFYEHFVGSAGSAGLGRFADKDAISQWAESYIQKCLALRFASGMTEDTFAPQATATRAQAATILKRVYIKIS